MATLFDHISLSPELLRAIGDMHYTEATDIQAGAIPRILEGRDVIGRSSTGTGKTAAFGIPVVELTDGGCREAQALVLSPTRELAMQIAGEMRKYAKYKPGIGIAAVYGGQSMELQIRQLRTANIVIGTPGRIMDHMRRRTLRLDTLRLVVLDEADEMLNMGFYEDIQTILRETPENRQTVLFSATMPPAILKITAEFQREPEIIAVDKGQRTLDAITQYFYSVPAARKMDALNLLLQRYSPARSVVFCNTKKMVDELTAYLTDHGFKAVGLHGDMKQMMRTRVMQDFKTGRTRILVATDVAARGIDVEDVDAVFNYDIPQEFEYYIHRIGRTGRAGKTGVSYTLACNRMQIRRVKEIEAFVNSPIIEQPIPSVEEILVRRQDTLIAKAEAAIAEGVGDGWKGAVDALAEKGYDPRDIACALFGMAASREKKLAPAIRPAPARMEGRGDAHGDARGGMRGGARGDGRDERRPGAGRVYVRLNLGRNGKVTPSAVVAALADASGLSSAVIGKIDIRAEETFVDMTAENARRTAEAMANGKLCGRPVTASVVSSKPLPPGGNRGGRPPYSRTRKPGGPYAG